MRRSLNSALVKPRSKVPSSLQLGAHLGEACGYHDHQTMPTRLLLCHDSLATNGWALGVITLIPPKNIIVQ